MLLHKDSYIFALLDMAFHFHTKFKHIPSKVYIEGDVILLAFYETNNDIRF